VDFVGGRPKVNRWNAQRVAVRSYAVVFWTERRRANVLLVQFGDLRADLDGEMRRIAAFLDIDIDHGKWPALVEAATFDSMRDRGEILMPQFNTTNLTGGAKRLFHKGSSGRWKDVLTDDDLRLYDAKLREKFPPDVAVWMEGGRRRTGDPANL
jgi:aryl sulfotransferase